MSLWKIGENDVSEEAQSLKDRIASKDAQIVAQEAKLVKHAQDYEELKATLNETLQQLHAQADKVLRLETDLATKDEQLQNAKVANINQQASLAIAEKNLHEQSLQTKHLQSIIDTLSNQSDSTSVEKASLSRDKQKLEHRVRELENIIASHTTQTLTRPSRPRSSSLNNLRVASLQDELEKAREEIKSKEIGIETLKRKLLSAQAEVGRCENEKVAIERRLQGQVQELHNTLEDREEELRFYKDGGAGQSREEDLMRRIEEDEAKIQAMEALLRDDRETRELERKLNNAESQLKSALAKVAECEEQAEALVAEREKAYDRIEEMKKVQSSPGTCSNLPDEVAEGIRNISEALARVREERNELRRHLEYLEPEHRFTEQALRQARDTISVLEAEHLSTARLQQDHSALYNQLSKSQQLILQQSRALHRIELAANVLVLMFTRLNMEHQTHLELSRSQAVALELRATQAEEREARAKLAKKDEMDRREDVEGRLFDTASALEEAERERANLSLQVHHLKEDIQKARQEFVEVEERYNNLQSQRLAALDSREITKALKERIEELEGRVMRRTQQIGEHQHDIKRMEVNLKLQEDRLAELTAELQTMTTEKDNMILDCAEARDARDVALRKVDNLEEQLEEVRSERDAIAKELELVNSSLNADLGDSRVEIASLRQRLVEAEALVTQTEAKFAERIEQLQTQKECLQSHLQDKQVNAKAFNHMLVNAHQLTVALALSQSQLKKLSLLRHYNAKNFSDESARLLMKITCISAENDSLLHRIDALERDASSSRGEFDERLSALTEEVDAARDMLRQERDSHEAEAASLRESKEQIGSLEEQLARINNQLAAERAEHATRLQAAENALANTKRYCEELEKQQSELKDSHALWQEEIKTLKQSNNGQIESLEKQLNDLNQSLASAQQEYNSLVELHDKCDGQHSDMRHVHEEQMSKLKDEYLRERESLEAELSALKMRNEELNRELTVYATEVETLRSAPQVDPLAQNRERELEVRLADADKDRYEMEQLVTRMEEEMSELHERISILRESNDRLEAEITGRVAEIQRLTSFQHFLQNQSSNHEKVVATLTQSLQEAEERFAEAEKIHREASTNLTLENLRLQQDIKSLQLEIQQLQTKPDTKALLAELEEKSRDMEELLRKKCEEIENHDDRVMDLMKEKKKFSAKVDNLTRKVQALQAKLTAVSASPPTSAQAESSSMASAADSGPASERPTLFKSSTFSATVSGPSGTRTHSPTNDQPISTTPEAFTSSRRVVPTLSQNQSSSFSQDETASPPSTLPQIEEGRNLDAQGMKKTVFSSVSPPDDPASTLGKRRRLHDEIEDEDDVPPSAFSAEVIPDTRSSYTPRSKRVFSAVHSGFTPVRRQASAIVRSISPSRSKPPKSNIADVTNARPPPLQDKAVKRTWLDKLRSGNGTSGEPNTFPNSSASRMTE